MDGLHRMGLKGLQTTLAVNVKAEVGLQEEPS